jgi:dTDP-4-amino-4,6-dideoxygalactose transaminase
MNGFQIPFTGTKRQYQSLRRQLLDTADKVWTTGQHLNGYYTETFEKIIAERCDRRFAISVNSGTQALIFAIRSLNLRYQSKIAIPSISFIATLNSILENDFLPHIIDVDSEGLIDLAKDSTEMSFDALLYVNLYGNMVDYTKLQLVTEFFSNKEKHDKFPVIEDAAQSFGSTFNGSPSGSFGDVSILSFDPMKNFNSYGSGGMVLTDNPLYASRIKDLATNGKENDFEDSGTNSRMSELDCACMLVKLGHFDKWQKRRTEIAEYWNKEFENVHNIKTLTLLPTVTSSWHKYPLFVSNTISRNRLQHQLREAGIETKVHYDKPLHKYSSFINCVSNTYNEAIQSDIEYQASQVKEGLKLANTQLSLPIYPELTDAEVEHVATEVKKNAET